MDTLYFVALEQNGRKIKKRGKDERRRIFDEFFAIVEKVFFFERKEILFNCAIRGYNFRRESTSGTSLIFLMLNERSTVIDEHQALCLVYLNISLENRESFKRELRGM